MIRLTYYFDKSIKNCSTFFFSFIGLTHQYLVKASMTHNKYSIFLFFEDNGSISAKSAAQMLSLNLP